MSTPDYAVTINVVTAPTTPDAPMEETKKMTSSTTPDSDGGPVAMPGSPLARAMARGQADSIAPAVSENRAQALEGAARMYAAADQARASAVQSRAAQRDKVAKEQAERIARTLEVAKLSPEALRAQVQRRMGIHVLTNVLKAQGVDNERIRAALDAAGLTDRG